jgi:hypothetical protein
MTSKKNFAELYAVQIADWLDEQIYRLNEACYGTIRPALFDVKQIFNGDEDDFNGDEDDFSLFVAGLRQLAGLFRSHAIAGDKSRRIPPKNSLLAARQAATLRYLAVAAAIKLEAGVRRHHITDGLYGRAWPKIHTIAAPEGRTRKELLILAHECAHVALRHIRAKPVHVLEHEAEVWAHAALRRHGIAVPEVMTMLARMYIAEKIRRAKRRGAKRIDPKAARYALGFVEMK